MNNSLHKTTFRSRAHFSLAWLLGLLLFTLPARSQTTTFNATGGDQTYTVPADGALMITARGGDGGNSTLGAVGAGGAGATVTASFPVLAGDELIVVVGGTGRDGGFETASGGGGSAVILKRNGLPENVLLLVAGAGGGAFLSREGGGASAEDGTAVGGGAPFGFTGGGGGFGADGEGQRGGKAGTLQGGGQGGPGNGGIAGGFGFGGGGGSLTEPGGGGGYGGGNAGNGNGAGGGSSFVQTQDIPGSNIARADGANGGGEQRDGIVTLTLAPCATLAASISGDTTITPGFGSNCTTLTANVSGGGGAPYTYFWKPDAQKTASIEDCPTETTTYSLTVADGFGCLAFTETTVSVQDVSCGRRGNKVTICYYGVTQCVPNKIAKRYLRLGATLGGCGNGNARIGYEVASDEVPLELSLKSYPNPVQDAVTVEVLSPAAGQGTFEVLDLQGVARQTRTKYLQEGRNEVVFRLGSLPPGVYLIHGVDSSNRRATVKVSKE